MNSHVKIYGETPRIQYIADGSSLSYEFPFAIFDVSDVDVYFNDILQTTSDYSVVKASNSAGGNIQFVTPPDKDTVITIIRNLSIERVSDFQEGSILRADVLNDEFDYQIACQQQIAEKLNRTMVLPPYAVESEVDLTLPTPSAGKAIVWNKDGTNLENSVVKVNELESALREYKEKAQTAASIATQNAEISTQKAQLASDKADIANDKAFEVSNALSSKSNIAMDNLSSEGKNVLVRLDRPDYSAKVEIGSSDNITWTAPCDGWVYFQGGSSGTGMFLDAAKTNDVLISGYGSNSSISSSCFLPVNGGYTYYFGKAVAFRRFFPSQGVV